MEECIEKFSTPDSPVSVDEVCSLIREQAVSFVRTMVDKHEWFQTAPVHEFVGFSCVESQTGKMLTNQAFKLLREDDNLLVMDQDEVELPDEYYVERVIVESGFPEYQEYATLKFQLDKFKRDQS